MDPTRPISALVRVRCVTLVDEAGDRKKIPTLEFGAPAQSGFSETRREIRALPLETKKNVTPATIVR